MGGREEPRRGTRANLPDMFHPCSSTHYSSNHSFRRHDPIFPLASHLLQRHLLPAPWSVFGLCGATSHLSLLFTRPQCSVIESSQKNFHQRRDSQLCYSFDQLSLNSFIFVRRHLSNKQPASVDLMVRHRTLPHPLSNIHHRFFAFQHVSNTRAPFRAHESSE